MPETTEPVEPDHIAPRCVNRGARSHVFRNVALASVLPFGLSALSPSCGRPQGPIVKPSVDSTGAPAALIQASRLRGHWRWSHVVEANGVRQVETERWTLDVDGTGVTGHYDRDVTFLSADGTPFECSQTLSYALHTRYELEGTASATALDLTEKSFTTGSSPCEGKYRRLGTYRGVLSDASGADELELSWKGGSQRLRRPSAEPPSTTAAHVAGAVEPSHGTSNIDGLWSWNNSSTSQSSDEVRVEREDWELSEVAEDELAGSYLRTVTVYDRRGRRFDCSGESFYSYSDRYQVTGNLHGSALSLNEVAVDAQQHPCLAQQKRHLDAARGTVGDGFLELIWRGSHRQVLHRPQPTMRAATPAQYTAAAGTQR